MRCTVHFYKLNYDFSPEFAEAHHGGQPSANNRLYDWEDELAVKTDVHEYNIVENGSFVLQGERAGEPFEEKIDKMILFEFIDAKNEKTTMACSHAIVKDYKIEENDENLNIEVIFEDREPLTNPIPGVYIAVQEFPKSLI